jgi:hypothetical protein
MSAPLRHNEIDPASMRVPPWMRRPKPVAPGDIEAPRFIGDRGMIELRRRLALDPQAAPEPPLDLKAGLSMDRFAVRFGAVVAVAALAAWAVVSYSRARLPANQARQARIVLAMAPNKVKLVPVHAAAAAVARPALAPFGALPVAQVAFAAAEKTPAPTSDVPLQQQPDVTIAIKTPEPAPPAAGSPVAASKPVIAPEQIATLVKRGKAFMTDGDVVAARLLLQRAAEAGNAEAALALGASFDPLIIKQAGAIGVQTDAAQARQWYEKAASLGSDAASKQLAKLASAGQ